ncbi:ubiquitin-like protein, partial [Sistotremastrum niveocremeum HHB9708]
VNVLFKGVGGAPVLNRNKFSIATTVKYQSLLVFLRKQLESKPNDPLFTYINGAFSPAPDDTISNLYKCFSTDGMLIVYYRYVVKCAIFGSHITISSVPAWG